MSSTYKLPLNFDPSKLREDLERVTSENWHSQFMKIHYDKGWSGIALYSAEGDLNYLKPGKSYKPTVLLSRCPYFREVLNTFKCEMHRVRVVKLESGAKIETHVDPSSGRGQSEVRLHIPIITNDEVEFYSRGERVSMKAGELWFIDTSYPHSVFNKSNVDRIHLIIDCVPNQWLYSLFPANFTSVSWHHILSYKVRIFQFMIWDILKAIWVKDRALAIKLVKILRRELNIA